MPQFRKKPVVISAEQWSGHGSGEDLAFFEVSPEEAEDPCEVCIKDLRKHAWIPTLEGGHRVCPGDWIITGVKGERYSCKPDIFEATYEPA